MSHKMPTNRFDNTCIQLHERYGTSNCQEHKALEFQDYHWQPAATGGDAPSFSLLGSHPVVGMFVSTFSIEPKARQNQLKEVYMCPISLYKKLLCIVASGGDMIMAIE